MIGVASGPRERSGDVLGHGLERHVALFDQSPPGRTANLPDRDRARVRPLNGDSFGFDARLTEPRGGEAPAQTTDVMHLVRRPEPQLGVAREERLHPQRVGENLKHDVSVGRPVTGSPPRGQAQGMRGVVGEIESAGQ